MILFAFGMLAACSSGNESGLSGEEVQAADSIYDQLDQKAKEISEEQIDLQNDMDSLLNGL